ncbi:hypothetical protein M5Y49_17485 [Escherichia coli]|nr:hypothetical protein [Escherichia coli]
MTVQFTKEHLVKTIEQLEHFATNLKWTNVSGAQTMLFAADGLRALLAAHEQEPVAWMWDIYGGHMYAKNKPLHMPAQPLYAHPAPVPAVPDEATPGNITIMASTHAPCGVTYQWDADECNAAADSWNACRAAMLNGGKS